MRRAPWFVLAAGAGVVVRQVVRGRGDKGLAGSLREFTTEVRAGMAEREAVLADVLGASDPSRDR